VEVEKVVDAEGRRIDLMVFRFRFRFYHGLTSHRLFRPVETLSLKRENG